MTSFTIIDFFLDPLLRGPTIASVLMCCSSSLVGVIILLQRRALVGETLSHACFPGITLGVIVFASFFSQMNELFSFVVLVLAALFAYLAMITLDWLQKKWSVHEDAALCFVLSSFFGLGVLCASRIQTTHIVWYKQVQTFLYGQAATMRDVHIGIYGTFLLMTILFLWRYYKEIQMMIFDRSFAESMGVNLRKVSGLLYGFICLAIVIGMRSVGVIMMAGMLIAPALAARNLSYQLHRILLFAGVIGGISGFLGNVLSVWIPMQLHIKKLSLPTGPMILIVACILCFFVTFLGPKKGLFIHFWWRYQNQKQCDIEQVIQWMDKMNAPVSLSKISHFLSSFLRAYRVIWILRKKEWIDQEKTGYILTQEGIKQAKEGIYWYALFGIYLRYLSSKQANTYIPISQMKPLLTLKVQEDLAEICALPIPPKDVV